MEDKKEHDHKHRPGESKVIPVIEERLRIDKEKVETGKYSISKKIHEEEVMENISVTEENVTIKRKEINQYVDSAPPAIRQEGDNTIISIVKEVLVVEKKTDVGRRAARHQAPYGIFRSYKRNPQKRRGGSEKIRQWYGL